MAAGYWRWDTADDAAPAESIARPDLLFVSGAPSPNSLYVRGLARDGLTLGTALSTFLRRQRAAWRLSPVPFERYSGLFDCTEGPAETRQRGPGSDPSPRRYYPSP